MANDYRQFSEVIPNLTPAEETWLRRQLEHIYVFGGQEFGDECVPKDLDPDHADWSGIRAWQNRHDIVCSEETGFEYKFDDGGSDWGRYLWMHDEEGGGHRRSAEPDGAARAGMSRHQEGRGCEGALARFGQDGRGGGGAAEGSRSNGPRGDLTPGLQRSSPAA